MLTPTNLAGKNIIVYPGLNSLIEVLLLLCVYIGATGISIPCGLSSSDKLPIGLQVMGRRFGDETILRVSRVLEAKAGFAYFRGT